jgi:medium-chain acyl-[acyl-carrier-protein] hydrolase
VGFLNKKEANMKKSFQLFCLPCAGGMAGVYLKWSAYLAQAVELIPVELAGRGVRWEEPLYQSLNEAVADVHERIHQSLDERPYGILGHSMGAVIAYELTHRIQQSSMRPPEHLFLAGHKPPHLISDRDNLHRLCDDDFIRKVISIGGTPPKVFLNKELAAIFLPILKADYKILETHKFKLHSDRIDCNISVFFGSDDAIFTLDDAAAWEQQYTKGACNIYGFAGGHFFIHEEAKSVVEKINSILHRQCQCNIINPAGI